MECTSVSDVLQILQILTCFHRCRGEHVCRTTILTSMNSAASCTGTTNGFCLASDNSSVTAYFEFWRKKARGRHNGLAYQGQQYSINSVKYMEKVRYDTRSTRVHSSLP